MEKGTFANISQRAADSYRRLLAGAANLDGGELELHGFFRALYDSLYTRPESFGLPLDEDLSIAETEENDKDKKQEVKRRLDKPKGLISAGLAFLMLAGAQGRLHGPALVIDDLPAAMKQTKVNKKFLAGMESLGVSLRIAGDSARLEFAQHPHAMLPALQALARGCADFENAELGKFQFARCDWRALRQAGPEPSELYRAFDGDEYALVMQLHEFFSQKGYKIECDANGSTFQWVVKYQGNRKVKASPLFQVDYDNRHARPLRMQIKCASTNRIAGVLPQQSVMLQADFERRVFNCNGDKCNWCRNKKTLGPSVLSFNGVSRTVCWFSNGDISEFNQNTFELVRQYEQMHAQLA